MNIIEKKNENNNLPHKKLQIANLTINGYFNYGNVLQKYALHQILLRYACVVDSIWWNEDNFLPHSWKWTWKETIKYVINWRQFRHYFTQNQFGWEMIRQFVIRRFCQQYIHIRYIHQPLNTLNNEYDYFIVGSDQVWNPNFSSTRCRDEFLTFTSEEKRIAYAASFGIADLPSEDEENFRGWIRGMKAISVREHTGANIIKKITGKDVPVLVDPTLLLTDEQWQDIEEKPSWYRGNGNDYLCTYFLGNKPSIINTIAEKYKLSVINILDKSNFDYYVTSPEEFIYLIHHAALIYTDSFHGTIFSIHFRKSFVVCDRQETGMENMSSRIETLLQLVHLETRHGTRQNNFFVQDPLNIEYPDLEPIFIRERQKSHEFLAKALGEKS
ncbi:hypothetical protein AB840_13110 [Megasphaera cerevisiae DSM 20462]|uniref:Polysaccharide pyruvyl transferase domain-containing protein n=1 Tax=Megasphaera cerevisiae DSM 20462 TaxID=1122219 RepID=A0A0J6WTQ1_9FIRM|nr:polysaccharide pyruvyl transferase family protein [Megasphaera cerevisiae]KMO85528.1 hypothetical protein AB840_13110 [Megasphaera cerevisiae DSM 20462]SKA06659.1 Polysaccharide pyruvyl transferase [Megasphaera cerevisiae DSM 20462]